MQRPLLAVAAASAAAGGAIFYAHAAQVWQKKRMHAGVAAEEAAEKLARDAEASAAPQTCASDVCELKATRFRDPVTGRVVAAPPPPPPR
jgi:hypothetical protein